MRSRPANAPSKANSKSSGVVAHSRGREAEASGSMLLKSGVIPAQPGLYRDLVSKDKEEPKKPPKTKQNQHNPHRGSFLLSVSLSNSFHAHIL